VLSRFRDRVYPCEEPTSDLTLCNGGIKSTQGAYNSTKTGGGIGANARVNLFKHMDIGLHALTGSGVGRYGTSGLPDATVNPNGTLAPLRSYQGLATVEYHMPRFDFYVNVGEEYVKRHSQKDPVSLKYVGYGDPNFVTSGCYTETPPSSGGGFGFGGLSNCNADTKSLIEGTMGFWIKVHSGPKGRLQFGPQYSYVARNAWTGTFATTPTVTHSAPHGIDNMFMTSFRYYFP